MAKAKYQAEDPISTAAADWDDKPAPTSRHQPRHKRPRRESRPEPVRNQRPDGVSERVWGIAEQWLETGKATTGERPPVRLPEFSQRLHERIQRTKFIALVLTERTDEFSMVFERGPDYVDDLLARMVEIFWDTLEVGTRNSSLQFAFLNDDWDLLVEQARSSLQVRWIKVHGKPTVGPKHWHKDENPYLALLREQRERAWLERCEREAEQEPPPPRGSRNDSLDRFRNRSGMVSRRRS